MKKQGEIDSGGWYCAATPDEFTPEEKVILGEAEPPGDPDPANPGDGSDPKGGEPTPEPKAELAPEEGDPEPKKEDPAPVQPDPEPKKDEQVVNMVPQTRFDEVYGKAKASERETQALKEALRRNNPQAFKELYPHEAGPESAPVSSSGPVQVPRTMEEAALCVVQGGQFAGKTLEQVYMEDPFAANALWADFQRTHQEQESAGRRAKEEAKTEIAAFHQDLARELFQKDLKDVPADKLPEIEKVTNDLIDFMTERRIGTIKDAYVVKNFDRILRETRAKAAGEALKTVDQKGVPGAGGKGPVAQKAGADAYMSMTPAEFAATVARMSDERFAKLMKEAPAELREKFPNIAWD